MALTTRRSTIPLLGILALLASCRAFEPGFGEFEVPAVRSLRDRAAQRDAIVQLRLDQLLPAVMREHGVDCWLVASERGNHDPLWPYLTRSGSEPDGRALLVFCTGDAGARRLALGNGLEDNAGIYELVTVGRDIADDGVGEWLRATVAGAATIAVNRSERVPLADGLRASDEAWLTRLLGGDPSRRLVSSEALVDDFLGRHLDVEAPLFGEAARLTVDLLHEVLTDEVLVAPETSLQEVAWALRERARTRGLELAFAPELHLLRSGESLEAAREAGLDLLLEAGDLVFVVAGIRYLGYSTRYGRWAYLPRGGEDEAPAEVTAGLARLADRLDGAIPSLRPAEPASRFVAAFGATTTRVRFGRVGYSLDPLPAGTGASVTHSDPAASSPRAGSEGSSLPAGTLIAVSVAAQEPGSPRWGWLALIEDVIVEAGGGRLPVPPQRSPWVVE